MVIRRVYMDHNATTPVDPEVVRSVIHCMVSINGNPSSSHAMGIEAREKMEAARSQVAGAIGADPEEVIFTSGGTESDNLAIQGIFKALGTFDFELIFSEIEHHAVMNLAKFMCFFTGIKSVPVDSTGCVDPDDVKKAITPKPKTKLVSIMHANNETGRIQPIKEISEVTREAGVLLHTDAVQSFGKIPVNVDELGVDLMSISSHKIYGPRGVGALYVRKGTKIGNIVFGGHQERDIRPGTENLPGIVGFGTACTIADQGMSAVFNKWVILRDYLVERLPGIEGAFMNTDIRSGHSLPNTLNVCFADVDGDSLLYELSKVQVYASRGAACEAGRPEPSHVLLAQGLSPARANQSIRLSMGKSTVRSQIEYLMEVLPGIVSSLRSGEQGEMAEVVF